MDILKTKYRTKEFFVYDTSLENHFISHIIKNGNLWEDCQYKEMKNLGSNQSILIDIGGEIGSHCIPLSDFYQKIITFEPNINNYNLILKNIEVNNIKNIISINKGCGDKNTRGCLTTKYQNVIELDDKGVVEIVTLDEELEKLNIDPFKIKTIKIDVEGFEYQVLLGALETIKNSKAYIYLETHPKGTVVTDCYDLLNNLGYIPLIKFNEHDWLWKWKK